MRKDDVIPDPSYLSTDSVELMLQLRELVDEHTGYVSGFEVLNVLVSMAFYAALLPGPVTRRRFSADEVHAQVQTAATWYYERYVSGFQNQPRLG